MSDVALNAKILKQVEYYFGDINLSKDQFMKNTLSEKDGWLSFDILLKFKRLSELTTDVDIIKESLSASNLLELGPNGIRRSPSNPPPQSLADAMELHSDKTVYMKGLPLNISLDELISWLEECAGPTSSVFLKRRMNKKLKGSAYATFKSLEDADKFIKSTDAGTYKEKSLIRMPYKDYIANKKKEREARKGEQKGRQMAGDGQNDSEVISRMTPGSVLELVGYPELVDADKIIEIPNAEKKEESTESADAKETDNGKGDTDEVSDSVKDKGINNNGTSRDSGMRLVAELKDWLNEKLSTSIPIAWIDVKPELKKFTVRFKEANTAVVALDKLKQSFEDGRILYKEVELSGQVLTGEEEISFWKSLFAVFQAKKRPHNHAGRGKFNHKRRRFN